MATQPGILHRLFTGFWTLIDQGRRSVVNIIFLLIIYVLIKIVFFADVQTIPTGAALVIKPHGYIVDELDYIEPVDEVFEELSTDDNKPPQTLLKDLLKAINSATYDDDIKALVLNLGSFYGAPPSKLNDVARAIETFKTSGKKVYAYSEFYNQSQYYLAAHADEVYMDPLGSVFIEGYGRFNTYFKGALDKLGINFHIFKVGTYKSAVEPFTRDNMSDSAKDANLHYLGDLWESYTTDVASARDLDVEQIKQYSDGYLEKLSRSRKNVSEFALEASLVDKLMTRNELNNYLSEEIGGNSSGDDFLQLNYKKYLKIIHPEIKSDNFKADKVAVVVAKGVIYNGNRKAGEIGGDSTAKLISQARLDDSVKALVLRVDSPGGSAYASEIIRREIVRTHDAGKPVVISMGSYAASGGYWISASADEIWASPTTITGSIGIFGILPTFEKPLNRFGIHRDGVGTSRLTGAFDPGKELRKDVGDAIQNSIENGYNKFLEIVAEGRNMSVEDVDKIAQGRVWSGKAAHELGLVDQLGGIEDAIKSAAAKAGLTTYQTKYIEQELTNKQQLIKNLFNSSISTHFISSISAKTNASLSQKIMKSPAVLMLQRLETSYQLIANMNDPQNIYAHCWCTVE